MVQGGTNEAQCAGRHGREFRPAAAQVGARVQREHGVLSLLRLGQRVTRSESATSLQL